MGSDVVIAGAGPGGLAAAMLLAADGARVTVFEKREGPGGRCGSFHAEGFTFDIGPTFFLYPPILEDIFAACGRSLHDEVKFHQIDPFYRLTFEGGGVLNATANINAMQRELAQFSPEDAARLPAWLKDNARKFAAFQPVLQKPFNSALDFLDASVLSALPALRPHLSVDADLKRWFRDPRVRQAFSFQTKYLGMSPFQCPSLFTILAFLEYDKGVLHPEGGCGALSRRMAEIAQEMGVTFRYGEPVLEIETEGRRAVGVRTASGVHAADAVVVNADFAQAMLETLPNKKRRRWTDETIASKTYSCSTFMVYLGVEGAVDLPHHSVVLAEDFEGNLDDIQSRMVLPRAPSFYVCNPSVTDPTMAPDGMSSLYFLAPVPNLGAQAVRWTPETISAFRDFALRRMRELLGLHDLESRIRYEKILTPVGWRDDLSVYRGATFNLAHTLGQMLTFRPHNRFEDVDGVYLVGGGTHPGSGLPVIYESARISTALLKNDMMARHGAGAVDAAE